ncbi:MAG: T9SS type A sorting domain-containing protein [Bacteroidia bacterium]|nr:T9SS type A sorting domain-containing protein [Bacteroidia bacterium]
MKRLFTMAAIFMALNFSAFAQLTNGGFENWHPFMGAENPDDWSNSNQLAIPGGDSATCFKITDRVSGAYAVKIKSFFSTGLGGTASGYIVNQYPVSTRPASLRFMYKAYFAKPDSSYCSVSLYLGPISDLTLVGYGDILLDAQKTTYTAGIANISYFNASTPDSAVISCYAGTNQNNSVLYIDDIGLSSNNASVKTTELEKVSVYPSPATNEINISVETLSTSMFVSIMDITGKEVIYDKLTSLNSTYNISSLESGIYTYKIFDLLNNSQASGKFSVLK